MFTPQQIEEVSFNRAKFGGYDIASVDAFLEPLTNDYLTLYKENPVKDKGEKEAAAEPAPETSTEPQLQGNSGSGTLIAILGGTAAVAVIAVVIVVVRKKKK